MTLTNRVTLFSLGAIAIILIGTSTTAVWLADKNLRGRAEQRLDAALDVLHSSVEVKPTGLQWETARQLTFSGDPEAPMIRWAVVADDGELLARSSETQDPDFLEFAVSPTGELREAVVSTRSNGEPWLLKHRLMTTPESPGDDPQRLKREYSARYPGRKKSQLMLTASCSLAPIEADIRRLTLLLASVSSGAWGVSALLARRFSRRALRPVRDMAKTIQILSPDDLSDRLPVSGNGDEISDLAKSFNELLDRVGESLERQRRFNAEASHQLRTPLAGILSQTELALRRPRSDEEYRHTLRLVRNRTDDLRKTVETLMFLARPDAESVAPPLEEIDLGDWLANFAERWRADSRQPMIGIELPDEISLIVKVQPLFLAELMDNLVDNALKHGSPKTAIRIVIETRGDFVDCCVIDQGPGVAQEDLPRVFEPFQRSRDARLRGIPGVGLGLTVARRLATAIGGTLKLENEPNAGCRLTVTLPISSVKQNENSI